jgi:hypothetical protein
MLMGHDAIVVKKAKAKARTKARTKATTIGE